MRQRKPIYEMTEEEIAAVDEDVQEHAHGEHETHVHGTVITPDGILPEDSGYLLPTSNDRAEEEE